jgi:hypothetical protein
MLVKEFCIFDGKSANYESKNKKVQEMKARKAGGKGQPTEEVANNPSSINFSSLYGDKKIVNASRNSLARFYATKQVIFRLIMIIGRPTKMGRTPYSINDLFPRIFSANDSNVRSWRRSQNVFERG